MGMNRAFARDIAVNLQKTFFLRRPIGGWWFKESEPEQLKPDSHSRKVYAMDQSRDCFAMYFAMFIAILAIFAVRLRCDFRE